jgi:hypothetical protein
MGVEASTHVRKECFAGGEPHLSPDEVGTGDKENMPALSSTFGNVHTSDPTQMISAPGGQLRRVRVYKQSFIFQPLLNLYLPITQETMAKVALARGVMPDYSNDSAECQPGHVV